MRLPPLGACLRVSVLALVALSAPGSLASSARAQEGDAWPMAGRDSAHSGTAEGGPAPPYRVAWEREIGAGGPAGGVAATQDVVVTVTREGVVALDPTGGKVLWERGRSPGSAGVPAISGDLVLHARGEGVSAQVVARDLDTGDLVWQATMGSTPAGGPTPAGELTIVGTGRGEVVALDIFTGEVVWRFETTGGVTGPPAVAEQIVVASAYQASSGTSTVYGLDLSSGEKPLWQLSPGAVGPPSAPAIRGGRVFVGISDLNVRAIDLEEGSESWTARSRDGFGPRQIPAAGEALVVADRTHVYRLDPGTGEELWAFRVADLLTVEEGRLNTLLSSAPAISGRTVLIGGADGMLSAIDLDSGRRVWRRDLGTGSVGPPAVSGGRIYAVTLGEGGKVVALEHDPDGRLVDEVSPTVLFVGEALLGFAAAAAVIAAAILLVFRFALRPRSAEAA